MVKHQLKTKYSPYDGIIRIRLKGSRGLPRISADLSVGHPRILLVRLLKSEYILPFSPEFVNIAINANLPCIAGGQADGRRGNGQRRCRKQKFSVGRAANRIIYPKILSAPTQSERFGQRHCPLPHAAHANRTYRQTSLRQLNHKYQITHILTEQVIIFLQFNAGGCCKIAPFVLHLCYARQGRIAICV